MHTLALTCAHMLTYLQTHAHMLTLTHAHVLTHTNMLTRTHILHTHVPCGLIISRFLGKGQPQVSRNMPEARTLGEPGSRAGQRAACGHLGGSGQTRFCTGTTQRAPPGQALLCSHFS